MITNIISDKLGKFCMVCWVGNRKSSCPDCFNMNRIISPDVKTYAVGFNNFSLILALDYPIPFRI